MLSYEYKLFRIMLFLEDKEKEFLTLNALDNCRLHYEEFGYYSKVNKRIIDEWYERFKLENYFNFNSLFRNKN